MWKEVGLFKIFKKIFILWQFSTMHFEHICAQLSSPSPSSPQHVPFPSSCFYFFLKNVLSTCVCSTYQWPNPEEKWPSPHSPAPHTYGLLMCVWCWGNWSQALARFRQVPLSLSYAPALQEFGVLAAQKWFTPLQIESKDSEPPSLHLVGWVSKWRNKGRGVERDWGRKRMRMNGPDWMSSVPKDIKLHFFLEWLSIFLFRFDYSLYKTLWCIYTYI